MPTRWSNQVFGNLYRIHCNTFFVVVVVFSMQLLWLGTHFSCMHHNADLGHPFKLTLDFSHIAGMLMW